MDLKIRDVAELLSVSETTIRRWLANGEIPAYRLGNQYRFSRIEIENWVLSRKMHKEKEEKANEVSEEMIELQGEKTERILRSRIGTQAYSLFRAIYKGGVLSNVPGNTKEEVICEALKQIAASLNLDADVLTELFLDREELMPTALNHGVAVPHTRDFLLQAPFDVVTIVYPEKPIEYGALDGRKVHTMFFLLACEDKRHLHLLAKLAHLTREEESLYFLQTRPDRKDLLDYIKKWEAKIRPIVEVPV
jgi:PTS system nitrogen regulatory IIA component